MEKLPSENVMGIVSELEFRRKCHIHDGNPYEEAVRKTTLDHAKSDHFNAEALRLFLEIIPTDQTEVEK